jgi:hypothetical protein
VIVPTSELASTPERAHAPRLALVLWSGDVGGAEVLNVKLADRLRELGALVTIVFVGTPWPLAERLSRSGLPFVSLELGRGRNVLHHPRRYAAGVAEAGPDGALLIERGFMASALRLGGYRGPVVAVEHGSMLAEQLQPHTPRLLLRQLGRVTGAWAGDAEIAVSDFMLARMRGHAHASYTARIYNGVDPDVYAPGEERPGRSAPVIGFAGRLIPGKGAELLIDAVAKIGERTPVSLHIAGDGPELSDLKSRAVALGVQSRVRFLGRVDDIPAFWRGCDIAAVPSDTWVESFSMVTLEAMSCGKAIVATRDGAIPELVVDGLTGTLVPPGDVNALAGALVAYVERPELAGAHGHAARGRAIEHFHIDGCARAYLDLFGELGAVRNSNGKRPGNDRSDVAQEAHGVQSGATRMKVSVVIPTFNSADYIQACLQSVSRCLPDAQVIVVDNDSTDNTCELVRQTGPRIELLCGHGNVGFGSACNLGAARAANPYVLYLNPDAELVEVDAEELARLAREHPFGMAGAMVLRGGRARSSLRRQSSHWVAELVAGRLLTTLSSLAPPPRYVERSGRWGMYTVSGAVCLVARDEFRSIGGFDERFFMYYEDTDLTQRYRQRGYPIRSTRAILASHVGGASTPTPHGLALGFLGWLEYVEKWHGRRSALRAAAIARVGYRSMLLTLVFAARFTGSERLKAKVEQISQMLNEIASGGCDASGGNVADRRPRYPAAAAIVSGRFSR